MTNAHRAPLLVALVAAGLSPALAATPPSPTPPAATPPSSTPPAAKTNGAAKASAPSSATPPSAAPPALTVDDYAHFRALVIDLVGRMPSRAELAAFERPGYDAGKFLDEKLAGPGYTDRLVRIYMDLLRLEPGPAIQYAPPVATLRRVRILGPQGAPEWVYYRAGQRRRSELTDGEFCLSQAEAGFTLNPGNGTMVGTPVKVSEEALEAATVMVRPWWLYRDYLASSPSVRLGAGWTDAHPLYQPIDDLRFADDHKTPVEEIRVCKEEAQLAETGTVYATGRQRPPGMGAPPPPGMTKKDVRKERMAELPVPTGRVRPLPLDDGYATQHAGEPLSCRTQLAVTMSVDCGCGPGLVYCMPGDSGQNDPRAFALPTRAPLGLDQPLGSSPQQVSTWHRTWWAEEAKHDLAYVFAQDRDLRELLTGRWSFVNGPLAHFYKGAALGSCCNKEKAFGMAEESEPLFDPKVLPQTLFPSDIDDWRYVADRGPHAAGLLTTPAFLTKYASRRARGAVLYTAFLCKSFVAPSEPLQPSNEANLMKRQGCQSCHATLEPLAAYFSRVEETEWVYLPEWRFPARNLQCRKNGQGRLPGYCDPFYDPAFSDGTAGTLRGAYASLDHAAAGPAGAGAAIANDPAFARCAVERITSSFLGRPLATEDDALVARLERSFVEGGYKVRPLVRAIVTSDAYAKATHRR